MLALAVKLVATAADEAAGSVMTVVWTGCDDATDAIGADAINGAVVKTSVAEASVAVVDATCCPAAAVLPLDSASMADGVLVASLTVLAGGKLADC